MKHAGHGARDRLERLTCLAAPTAAKRKMHLCQTDAALCDGTGVRLR
jgi:hypothetical protein